MKLWTRQFNTYLMLAAMLALFCSCQTDKKDKEAGALRVHIEANSDNTGTSQTVSVLRSNPVPFTIEREPILTEVNIVAARVFDTPGGVAIEVRFDETATWILEQYSAGNSGRHFVIFGQWGDKLANGRWLAAPTITRRIPNGVLAFTADVSREEADQLVLGLNNVAKKIHKGLVK